MMKGALSDRFLLSLSGILLLAVFASGYFILEGQGMTKEQKDKAVVIAMNDPYVREQIEVILGAERIEYQASRYRFTDVVPTQFHETSPGIDRYRTLPAVKILVGLDGSPGTNVIAFVDLTENRVAYVGFEKRAGVNNTQPEETFINTSIVDTGYGYNQNLTEEQKADALAIALGDKKVQDELSGKNYTSGVDISHFGGWGYIETYPTVTFAIGKVYEPGYMVLVRVDTNKKKVIDVTTHGRTAMQWEMAGNTSSATSG